VSNYTAPLVFKTLINLIRFYCLMIFAMIARKIFRQVFPVEHGDSLGNQGTLGPGSVQWMTAGSGILHQEMPQGNAQGQMHGFQLWANLPGALKMTAPRYQDIEGSDITEVTDDDGTRVKIIIGDFRGIKGPVDGIAADPQYLDITIPAGVRKTLPIDTYRRAFAYVFEGTGQFKDASHP